MKLCDIGTLSENNLISPIQSTSIWNKEVSEITAVEVHVVRHQSIRTIGKQATSKCFSVLKSEIAKSKMLGQIEETDLSFLAFIDSKQPRTINDISSALLRFSLEDRQAIMLACLLNMDLLQVTQLSRNGGKDMAKNNKPALRLIGSVVPHIRSPYLFWNQPDVKKRAVPRYGLESRFNEITEIKWSAFRAGCQRVLKDDVLESWLQK